MAARDDRDQLNQILLDQFEQVKLDIESGRGRCIELDFYATPDECGGSSRWTWTCKFSHPSPAILISDLCGPESTSVS